MRRDAASLVPDAKPRTTAPIAIDGTRAQLLRPARQQCAGFCRGTKLAKLEGSRVEGSRLRADLDVIIVAIKRPGAPMVFNPEKSSVEARDTLVMLGARAQLDRAEQMARP